MAARWSGPACRTSTARPRRQAGEEIVVSSLESGLTLGMTICYDLRFPELYWILTLRGAEVIAVPAAFTLTTTRDHWEVLVRARAIENQVVADLDLEGLREVRRRLPALAHRQPSAYQRGEG